jgi:EmrB/QacA subfamily drug resistance transporter
MIVLALAGLDFGLESSIVLPALPAIADHYDASVVALAWFATGFLLASAVAIPLLGRLGDLFGKRLMLLVALSGFGIGSLLCAVTDSVAVAIAGRVVQGVGGAAPALSFGLARDTVDREQLPRALGIIVGGVGVGATAGFLLSGVLVDGFSVAAIFWFLLAAAIVLSIAVLVLVPESPVRARLPIDGGGAALLALGLTSFLVAISRGNAWGWSSARILTLFAAAGVSLCAFVLHERRVRDPLVDLGLVATRPFAEAHVCQFLFGFCFIVPLFVVPQIAATPEASGYGFGFTTTQTGLLQLPTGIGILVGGHVAGRIIESLGPRRLVVGASALLVAGNLSLAAAHGTVAAIVVANAVVGLGVGLTVTGIAAVVVGHASPDKTGIAAAVNYVMRPIGGAVGAQVAAAAIIAAGLAGTVTDESGFTKALVISGIAACLGLLSAAFLPAREVDVREAGVEVGHAAR